MTSLKKIAKIVGGCGTALLMACLAAQSYFVSTYIHYPRSPNVMEGNTVPYEVKGIVVFITTSEREQIGWVSWITLGSIVVIALALVVLGKEAFSRRRG